MANVRIDKCGEKFAVKVDGVMVAKLSSMRKVAVYIKKMEAETDADFTVGEKEELVEYWLDGMREDGYID